MRFSADIVEWIVGARGDLVEAGKVPERVGRFLTNVYDYGNPFRMLRTARDAWAEGIKRYEPGDEYLFYVGCVGCYDEPGQRMARSVADLLGKGAVSYGILGAQEECCGNEVYNLGEMTLFQALAEKNVRQFRELGVKKVITLSPHAYNAMKNSYPRFGADFEVCHYTQIVQELLERGVLRPNELPLKVTYHDPCYLGRHNLVYDTPRAILGSIPGLELVEMERNRENAFCCGGGSGNFAMDLLGGGADSPARRRVREARDTGAEVLATACPACTTMLVDAVKAEELEDSMTVLDVSEVLGRSLRG